ncbi:MAG: iron-containing alcohol dehydrogenase [Nannocystaceae bacterium]|nr:iron-containing alcohol dehydrogenase [bacterium]
MNALTGNFNYPTAYRIGAGRLAELASACSELGMTRPLIVTDPGVAALPWFSAVTQALDAAGLGRAVFSDVQPNPTGSDVEAGVAALLEGDHDGVVLIGGGSAMDVGKSVALVARNPGGVFDYEDVGDNWTRADAAKIPPMIAVPTTAGTGSEVGRAGVIVDERDHGKKIIFHPKMQPALVLADPEVTLGLPAGLTAATGMDALAHCFEAYCAPGYHPMADGIALEGMRLVAEYLPRAYTDGADLEARTHMMMAASMGATAFQKGLGLVHALSHPLGGATGLHHGTANAIFLPYVMVFNRDVIEDRMERLSRFLRLPKAGFDGVMAWMLELRAQLGMPHTLAAADGFDEAMAARLAPMAVADPSMSTNPKQADAAACERVFLAALHGSL